MSAVVIKERPILFKGEMVRAILEGRKTQTRRTVKGVEVVDPYPENYIGDRSLQHWRVRVNRNQTFSINSSPSPCINQARELIQFCPYGQAGDRLWVRETWLQSPVNGQYWYRADKYEDDFAQIHQYKWKPSIHMPRAASRITLEVVDVRVERLQDITEEDAIAEGIWKDLDPLCFHPGEDAVPLYWNGSSNGFYSAVESFRHLWDSINSDRGYGWDSNPFVWCVSFKQIAQQSGGVA